MKKEKRHDNSAEQDAATNFERLLSDLEGYAQFETEHKDDVYARSELFSYAISALGGMMESEMALSIFTWKDDWDYSFHIPGTLIIQRHQETELAPFRIATQQCERPKLMNAIQGIFTHSFRSDWNSTNGLLMQELDFVAIVNGGHHISAARLYRQGRALLDKYTLKTAFPCTTTDGAWWYVTKNGVRKRAGRVPDYRYALMYELARLRAEMLDGEVRAIPPSAGLTKLEPPAPEDDAANWALLEGMDELRRENYVLKKNNKLLHRRMTAAEAKLRGKG